MRISKTATPLRPLAVGVATAALVMSSLLVSAASIGSPKVSGYGIDQQMPGDSASR
jgi:hypothetical protein